MSVASKNPFDLLNDDGDSPEVAAPSSKVTKEQSADAESAPAARGGQKGRTGPASRGGRYYQRGGAGKSAPREQQDGAEEAPREGKRSGDDSGRGRGRGGRGRGDRGRGAGGRGRPFDRHSATGKTDSDKKIHQGWGGDEGKSELKAEEEGNKDAAAETPTNDWAGEGPAPVTEGWGAPAPAEVAADVEKPTKDATETDNRRFREEEEDNTLTLDQYLAKQKEKVVVPKLEGVRQANDGEGDLFKDAIKVVKGGDEDAYFAGKPKASKQRTKQKEEKVVIEIDGTFSDQTPRGGGRGGRGGRGGDRGDRGDRARGARGGGRGGRGRGRGDFHAANGNTAQVDVDDQSAFPSLA